MTTMIAEKTLTTELRLAYSDAGHGSLTGLCVPYNKISYTVGGEPDGQRMMPGAFATSIQKRAGKVRLTDSHIVDGAVRRPYGVATRLWEELEGDAPGLYGEFRFYDTPTGQEGRAEAKAGTYGGLSIGWRDLKAVKAADGVTDTIEAALHHVSLVDDPAFEDAEILQVASATTATLRRSPWADWKPPETVIEFPDLADMR